LKLKVEPQSEEAEKAVRDILELAARSNSAKRNWPLLHLRVMMPDRSDCIFNGRPKGNAIEGSYLCLQGGGLIERGIRRAGRNY
jgi:hypothetical protein